MGLDFKLRKDGTLLFVGIVEMFTELYHIRGLNLGAGHLHTTISELYECGLV